MSSVPAFHDLMTGLTAILESCLFAYLIVALITVWSGWGELQLLQRGMAGVAITEAEATASDTRQALLGVLYALVFIVTGVVFLRWIVLANRNARVLGAGGMRFTPGWSVGWYFVPIAIVSRLHALQTAKHARVSVVAPDAVRPEQDPEAVR